jgi:hypothetical protein
MPYLNLGGDSQATFLIRLLQSRRVIHAQLDQSETSNSNCSGFNTFAKAASH